MTWSVMSIDRCSLMAPICGGGAATRRLADVRSASAKTARDAATTVLRILHLRELRELYEIRRVPQERLALIRLFAVRLFAVRLFAVRLFAYSLFVVRRSLIAPFPRQSPTR